MNNSGFFRWGALIARFLTGQVAVQLVNLVTGFLILRFLSINEYAIYILASLLVTVGALGSDMGISQGVISIGAPIRDDKTAFSGLVKSAIILRRRFFVLAIPGVTVLAYVVLKETENRIPTMIAVTLLAMATAWVQQSVTLGVSVLNAHHDSSGLTRAGLGSALYRLILVAMFCRVAPFALTALAINLAGMLLNAWLLSRNCRNYLNTEIPDHRDFSAKLLEFVKPLIPGVVYHLIQGQIAVFLLGFSGATGAVAEVGALGRLGQVIGVLGMVNGFFIQPYFARIADYRNSAKRAVQVIAALLLVFAVVTVSTLIFPELWLAILGPNYKGLAGELVIAMAGAQLSVAGAVIYTMVIAMRVTRGQWLQIALGLGAQVAFLVVVGVKSTHDALLLNLVPAAAYVILQLGLLTHVLVLWRKHGTPA